MRLSAFYYGLLFTKLIFLAQSEALQCGGTILIDADGYIQSPNYPNSYEGSGSCIWILKAPTGYKVRLEFLDFDVEADDVNKCDFDSLKIRNGNDTHSPLLGKILCGQSMPEIVTSTGNIMSITFNIDELSMMESRFNARYSKVEMNGTGSCLSSACGGTYENTPSCDIQSPGFPSSYDSNLNCSWLIIAPNPNHIISVQFFQLKLNQPNSLCRNNKVTLYDVSLSKRTVISEPVCDLESNRMENKKILSQGPRMLVQLLTTESSKTFSGVHGFHLKFEIINPASTIKLVTTTPSAPVKLLATNSLTISTEKQTTTTTTSPVSSKSLSQSSTTTTTTSAASTSSRTASTTTKTTSGSTPKDENKDTPDKSDVDKLITSSNKTTTDTPKSITASPVVLSGVVIGIIVVIAVVVLVVLLLVAFSHWKKRNSRITRRLREEDARSDANTLLSSIDSREFTDMSKAKQKQHPVITDQTEFSHEIEGLL